MHLRLRAWLGFSKSQLSHFIAVPSPLASEVQFSSLEMENNTSFISFSVKI